MSRIRKFFFCAFVFFAVYSLTDLFVKAAFAEEIDRIAVAKRVEEILGKPLQVLNFSDRAKSGVYFDIACGEDTIFFSKTYLDEYPDEAANDLRSAYSLVNKHPQIFRINVWYSGFSDITRAVFVGSASFGKGQRVDLGSDWETILHKDGVRVFLETGNSYLISHLPWSSYKFDNKMITYLIDFFSNPYKWVVVDKWKLDIDVFKRDGDSIWILKGRESTIFYNTRTKEFSPGELWPLSTKFEWLAKNKMLVATYEDYRCFVELIHTDSNTTLSAYWVYEQPGRPFPTSND